MNNPATTMSSNRIDSSAARAQLVARIAERIRMSPRAARAVTPPTLSED